MAIDVLGGARISIVDTEIQFSGAGLPTQRVADTQTWADPVVGGASASAWPSAGS